jgi:hypothetical protein
MIKAALKFSGIVEQSRQASQSGVLSLSLSHFQAK